MKKNRIKTNKYLLVLVLTFSACTSQEIKNAPKLPSLDQPSFSYEDAIEKEKILLERAKTVQFTSEISSK